MKQLKISKGLIALLDDEDYERIIPLKWHVHCSRGYSYVAHSIWKDGKPKSISLHRLLLNAPIHLQVDHINGDGLDNRKSNLRLCSKSQNLQNRKKSGKISKYKGVWWYKKIQKWGAGIQVNHKRIFLGVFPTEIEAAKAYDKAAKIYHRQFARLNFSNNSVYAL